MNLIIYSILTRLAIGSPLVDDSTDNFPTTTNVYSYPVSTPTNTAIPIDSYPVSIPTDITIPIDNYPVSTPTGVVIPVYTQVSEPGYTGKPHPKWNHRHKHHHKHHHKNYLENNKYPWSSQTTVVSYPAETSSATGHDQSGSGSSNTPVYTPTSYIGYTNDSLNSNTGNSSDDDTADTETTNDVSNDGTIDNTTTDDTTDGSTTDSTPSTTTTVDQPSSSSTSLPDFYSQIQASSFGDV